MSVQFIRVFCHHITQQRTDCRGLNRLKVTFQHERRSAGMEGLRLQVTELLKCVLFSQSEQHVLHFSLHPRHSGLAYRRSRIDSFQTVQKVAIIVCFDCRSWGLTTPAQCHSLAVHGRGQVCKLAAKTSAERQ